MRDLLRKNKIGWPEMDYLEPGQYRIQQIIEQLDQVVIGYEKNWGVDRLPKLVSKELYDKWVKQCEKLDAAIQDGHLPLVEELAQGCVRGLSVLEADARKLGYKPHDAPTAWTCAMPGGRVLVVAGNQDDAALWQANAKPEDKFVIWTIQEIANVIDSDHDLVNVLFRKANEPKAPELKSAPFDFDKGDMPEF